MNEAIVGDICLTIIIIAFMIYKYNTNKRGK